MSETLERFSENEYLQANRPQRNELFQREQEWEAVSQNMPAATESRHVTLGPERGRLQEVNAAFLNERLINYTTQVNEQETQRVERKYGRGWWGRAKRWMEETTLGKTLKVGSKVVLGGLAAGAVILNPVGLAAALTGTLGAALGAKAMLFTPVLLSLGARALVDGSLEGIQFGRERGSINEINDARNRRLQNIGEIQQIRNQLTDQGGRTRGTDELITIDGVTQALGQRLENLIAQNAQDEQTIIQNELNLSRSQMWWKVGRFVAGLTTVGLTAAYAAMYGVNMGVQDFDKIHELAKDPNSAEWIKNMAQNMDPNHTTKWYLDKVHFDYTQAEILTNNITSSAVPHAAAGTLSHGLGANAPWFSIFGSLLGTVGGLGVAAATEISDIRKLSGLSRDRLRGAIFSVTNTPRGTYATPIYPTPPGAPPVVYRETEEADTIVLENFWRNFAPGGETWVIRGTWANPNAGGRERFFRVNKLPNSEDATVEEIDERTGRIITRLPNQNYNVLFSMVNPAAATPTTVVREPIPLNELQARRIEARNDFVNQLQIENNRQINIIGALQDEMDRPVAGGWQNIVSVDAPNNRVVVRIGTNNINVRISDLMDVYNANLAAPANISTREIPTPPNIQVENRNFIENTDIEVGRILVIGGNTILDNANNVIPIGNHEILAVELNNNRIRIAVIDPVTNRTTRHYISIENLRNPANPGVTISTIERPAAPLPQNEQLLNRNFILAKTIEAGRDLVLANQTTDILGSVVPVGTYQINRIDNNDNIAISVSIPNGPTTQYYVSVATLRAQANDISTIERAPITPPQPSAKEQFVQDLMAAKNHAPQGNQVWGYLGNHYVITSYDNNNVTLARIILGIGRNSRDALDSANPNTIDISHQNFVRRSSFIRDVRF